MMTLLGSLLGFAGSIVPSVIEFFNRKQSIQLELEKMKLQAELMKVGVESELKIFRARADSDEHARLIEHDISMQNDTGFMGSLRKSVRPVITYMFFLLFASVKIATLLEIMGDEDQTFAAAINLIWDSETQAIFAAIISFWFGDRAIKKYLSVSSN
jgi:hypothetical protein